MQYSCWICRGSDIASCGTPSVHSRCAQHLANLRRQWLTHDDDLDVFATALGIDFFVCKVCGFRCARACLCTESAAEVTVMGGSQLPVPQGAPEPLHALQMQTRRGPNEATV